MSTMRATDTTAREYFRSDRFMCERGLWYFQTREKTVEGPFASRKCAEQYLQTYIALARISTGFSPELQPLDAEDTRRRPAQRSAGWVLDPYHKRFGSAA